MNFFVLIVCKWGSQGQNRLSPWPPRFSYPLGHSPQPTSSLVQVWRLFGDLFLVCWEIPAPKGQNRAFHAQDGTRGVWGRKGAVLGLPTSTLDGPRGGLVERNISRGNFQKVHQSKSSLMQPIFLNLPNNMITPLKRARLHESPSPVANLPFEDGMLRLLSSLIGPLLFRMATRRPTLYLQAWMLLTFSPQLPPLTT